MAETSSIPRQPPADIMQAAERAQLGGLRRSLTRWRKAKKEVEPSSFIYEFNDGFIFRTPGGTPFTYPFRQVSVVYLSSTAYYVNGQYSYTSYSCELRLSNGGKLTVAGNFHDPAIPKTGFVGKKWSEPTDEYEFFKLLSAVSVFVSKAQLPHAVAKLEQGGEMIFGGMRISAAGVRFGTEIVPWKDVKDVKTHDGKVQFKISGLLRSAYGPPVQKIPNLPLFFMLVEVLRRG